MDVRGTALFFLHQQMFDNFNQLNMSTVRNGTTGASDTGPASGYNLMLSHLFVVFVLFLYRLSTNMNNLCAAIILLILNNSMIYMIDFGFKIYQKMPTILTLTSLVVIAGAPHMVILENKSKVEFDGLTSPCSHSVKMACMYHMQMITA
jgi:hypothetical protein